MGDAPEPLVQALQDRFPNAELKGGDAEFERVVAQAVALVEEPRRAFRASASYSRNCVPAQNLDILAAIPPGETLTYAEVAARAGCPKAVRAVANACASNSLAIAIPCHRVVRTGGGLSGYRWGVERKAALLKREGAL